MLLRSLEDSSAGAISKQDAGGAVGPIGDGAQLLDADDERGVGIAGRHHSFGDGGAVDEAGAGGADVERGGAAGAERGLKVDRGRWQQTIRRRGAEHDDVELTRLNACLFHRLARRRGGEVGGALGLGDVPLLDAGSLDDPLVGRVDDRKSTRLNSSHGYISYAV